MYQNFLDPIRNHAPAVYGCVAQWSYNISYSDHTVMLMDWNHCCHVTTIRSLTPSKVLPLFDINEHNAVICLVLSHSGPNWERGVKNQWTNSKTLHQLSLTKTFLRGYSKATTAYQLQYLFSLYTKRSENNTFNTTPLLSFMV